MSNQINMIKNDRVEELTQWEKDILETAGALVVLASSVSRAQLSIISPPGPDNQDFYDLYTKAMDSVEALSLRFSADDSIIELATGCPASICYIESRIQAGDLSDDFRKEIPELMIHYPAKKARLQALLALWDEVQ